MKHIAQDQLPYATPPYDWEYIATRSIGRYRIRDAKDNAVGHADSEAEAIELTTELNRDWQASMSAAALPGSSYTDTRPWLLRRLQCLWVGHDWERGKVFQTKRCARCELIVPY